MKRLDGWEPTQTHTTVADGVVEVTREAEWDDTERGLMLALALYEAQLCPSGHWMPDSSAAENEERYAGRVSRCHACTAASMQMKVYKDDPHSSGLLFGAELKRG